MFGHRIPATAVLLKVSYGVDTHSEDITEAIISREILFPRKARSLESLASCNYL